MGREVEDKDRLLQILQRLATCRPRLFSIDRSCASIDTANCFCDAAMHVALFRFLDARSYKAGLFVLSRLEGIAYLVQAEAQ